MGAWRDRADANDGLLPDNVGLSGEVGECMGGRWYGSMYGWTFPHGLYNVASAAIVAGTACYLATGDAAWLDLPRTQIGKAMELGEVADVRARPISLAGLWTGQFQALGDESEAWLVPYRHGTNGWCDWQPLSPVFPAALWNAAGEDVDLGMLEEIRRRETYDWRKVFSFRTKEDAGHEQPWLCFLRGENPDYPVQILRAALTQVHRRMEQIRQDDTDPRDNSIHQWQELNPVTCEALIQLTLGAPQMIYNGGLLLAPVRYFDAERRRPGLPRDVGALVERVEGQRLALRLVNLSHTSSRRLVVQAGTFGEHEFTELRYSKRTGAGPGNVEAHDAGGLTAGTETSAVNASRFEVELPPGTETRMEIGLLRAVNTASYGGPWD